MRSSIPKIDDCERNGLQRLEHVFHAKLHGAERREERTRTHENRAHWIHALHVTSQTSLAHSDCMDRPMWCLLQLFELLVCTAATRDAEDAGPVRLVACVPTGSCFLTCLDIVSPTAIRVPSSSIYIWLPGEDGDGRGRCADGPHSRVGAAAAGQSRWTDVTYASANKKMGQSTSRSSRRPEQLT